MWAASPRNIPLRLWTFKEMIKNWFFIILGVVLGILIISSISLISSEYFEYLIPGWVKFLLFYWIVQLIEQVPPFKDSKIVLFQKNINEKE